MFLHELFRAFSNHPIHNFYVHRNYKKVRFGIKLYSNYDINKLEIKLILTNNKHLF